MRDRVGDGDAGWGPDVRGWNDSGEFAGEMRGWRAVRYVPCRPARLKFYVWVPLVACPPVRQPEWRSRQANACSAVALVDKPPVAARYDVMGDGWARHHWHRPQLSSLSPFRRFLDFRAPTGRRRNASGARPRTGAVRDRRRVPGAHAPGFTPPPLSGLRRNKLTPCIDLRICMYGCHWWLAHQCDSPNGGRVMGRPAPPSHWWTSHQWHPDMLSWAPSLLSNRQLPTPKPQTQEGSRFRESWRISPKTLGDRPPPGWKEGS
jgi:hypothetical protein